MTKNKQRWILTVSVWCVNLLTSTLACAHPEFQPNGVNRYVKFILAAPNQIRASYSLLYGALPALALKRLADRDGNGRLDPSEWQSMAEQIAIEIARHAKIDIDGRKTPVQLNLVAGTVPREATAITADPLALDWSARWSVATTAAEHDVLWDDDTTIASLAETEVKVDEGPGVELLWLTQGVDAPSAEEIAAKKTSLLFRGPKKSVIEDRSVRFHFRSRVNPAARANGFPIRNVAIVAGVLLLAAIIGLMARRKVSRRRLS